MDYMEQIALIILQKRDDDGADEMVQWLRSSHCSCRGLQFSYQHQHSSLGLSATPVPRNQIPPLASSDYRMHSMHINS